MPPIRRFAAAALILASTPVAAAEARLIHSCLSSGADRAECVGVSARQCLRDPEASTTIRIAACYGAERQAWEATMAMMLTQVANRAAAVDAQDPEAGAADASNAAQRAWFAFRDAECRAEAARRAGVGAVARVEIAACAMRLAAERVFTLGDQLRDP